MQTILSAALIGRIVLVSGLLCAGAFALFAWERTTGASEIEARTVAVTTFVIGELFYLFNCRSVSRSMFGVGVFSNPWIWVGVTAMLILQLGFIYLPVMNLLFHSAAVRLTSLARIIAVGFIIYAIIGIEKLIRRRLHHTL